MLSLILRTSHSVFDTPTTTCRTPNALWGQKQLSSRRVRADRCACEMKPQYETARTDARARGIHTALITTLGLFLQRTVSLEPAPHVWYSLELHRAPASLRRSTRSPAARANYPRCRRPPGDPLGSAKVRGGGGAEGGRGVDWRIPSADSIGGAKKSKATEKG